MRLRLRRLPDRPPVPAGPGPVVLVLPARNEAARVGTVIDRMPSAVLGRPTRCIVVDDASTDATAAVAAAHGATVITPSRGHGLGAAVRTGLRAGVDAGAAVVAFCDADGEYDPAELAALAGPIVDGTADYVVGSRFAGSIGRMHPHRRLGNHLLTVGLRAVAGEPITDGQSGYRALSARAAAVAEIAHDYNYAQVLTLDLLGRGFRYREVPITYSFREGGRSFVRLGRYLRAVGPAVWRLVQASGQPATVN
jgi:glycosyltransferase involved in cell wall biosynthesis